MKTLVAAAKASVPLWIATLVYETARRVRLIDARRAPLVMCTTAVARPATAPGEYTIELLHGDEPPAGWIETLGSAGIQVTTQTWVSDFAAHPAARVIGIIHDGRIVGTAGVSPLGPPGSGVGLVTWVGLRQEHQGRGLGKPLIVAVLREAAASGLHTILLLTDDHRLAAIRTYLATGFRPCLNSWDWTHRPRWARIVRELKDAPMTCADSSHAEWISRIG